MKPGNAAIAMQPQRQLRASGVALSGKQRGLCAAELRTEPVLVYVGRAHSLHARLAAHVMISTDAALRAVAEVNRVAEESPRSVRPKGVHREANESTREASRLGLDSASMARAWSSALKTVRAAGDDPMALIERAAKNIESLDPNVDDLVDDDSE